MTLPTLAELAAERQAQQEQHASLRRMMEVERLAFAILGAALREVPVFVGAAGGGPIGAVAAEIAVNAVQSAIMRGSSGHVTE